MTVTNKIKILNRKIMQNEAQYDLDRKAAKISALSSNNFQIILPRTNIQSFTTFNLVF